MIQYEATVIAASGPNDRVSDLNSFWMATDPQSPTDLFAHPRSGAFADYNTLANGVVQQLPLDMPKLDFASIREAPLMPRRQVTVPTAFTGPLKLKQRLGTLEPGKIAATDPARLQEVFREKPAIHRFPGNMAQRVQDLATECFK